MGLTLKAVLYEARADGSRSVAIRITIDRKVKYWPVGLILSEKNWNEAAGLDKNNWVRKTHEDATRYNKMIRGRLREAESVAELLRQIETVTASRLKEVLELIEKRQDRELITVDRLSAMLNSGPDSISLTGFWFQFIRSATDSMQTVHQPQFKQLHAFFGRVGADGFPVKNETGNYTNPILFRELTFERIAAWEDWLKDTHKNTSSTIQQKIARLKSVLDEAVEQEIIPLKMNPLRRWQPKTIIYEHEQLTTEEFKALESILPELAPNSTLLHSLQIYRLQYYAHGMRIGDALCLKPHNIADGRLRYRMGKNKKRFRSIQLHDTLNQIIAEYLDLRQTSQWRGGGYLFPFLKKDIENLPYKERMTALRRQTQRVNNSLKKVAEIAGIKKDITTHVARHSFSNNALQYRNGDGTKPFDIYDVSKAMGHGSVALTQDIYGDRYLEDEGDVLNKMFPSKDKERLK